MQSLQALMMEKKKKKIYIYIYIYIYIHPYIFNSVKKKIFKEYIREKLFEKDYW